MNSKPFNDSTVQPKVTKPNYFGKLSNHYKVIVYLVTIDTRVRGYKCSIGICYRL